MAVLDTIRRNPVALFAAAVAGVGGWIVAEALAPHGPPAERPLIAVGPQAAFIEAPPPQIGVPPAALTVLPMLRPGMPRAEVEGILGIPPADAVDPVTVTDGQLRYRASYDLGDPEPLATVRPIKRHRMPPPPDSTGIRVAIEFDASKPGHPLVDILYLDPLF